MVGNAANAATINGSLTALAEEIRDWAEKVTKFQEGIVDLGLAGLQAAGYSAGDAQTAMNMASYLNTVAAVYLGQVGQPTPFSFDNALSQLWEGLD